MSQQISSLLFFQSSLFLSEKKKKKKNRFNVPSRSQRGVGPTQTTLCVNMLQDGGGRSPAERESLLPGFCAHDPPPPRLLLLPLLCTMARLVWRPGADQSLDADGVLNNGSMRAAEGLSSFILAAEPPRPSTAHRPAIVWAPCLSLTGLQKPAIVFNYSRQPLKVSCPCVPDFPFLSMGPPSLSPVHSVSVYARLTDEGFPLFFVMISEPPSPSLSASLPSQRSVVVYFFPMLVSMCRGRVPHLFMWMCL